MSFVKRLKSKSKSRERERKKPLIYKYMPGQTVQYYEEVNNIESIIRRIPTKTKKKNEALQSTRECSVGSSSGKPGSRLEGTYSVENSYRTVLK
tara:strand:- start:61 stop:342 length:282 start_codon:yes stop_codon:yes gene_type:complete